MKRPSIQRISITEFENQARDYTREQLEELSNAIRRNPQLAQRTYFYKLGSSKFSSLGASIRLIISALVSQIVCLLMIFTGRSAQSGMKLLEEGAAELLCGKFEGSGLWALITGHVALLLPVFLSWFLFWVVSMKLENLKIQQKITNGQHVALVVLQHYVTPFLLCTFLGLDLIHFIHWLAPDVKNCELFLADIKSSMFAFSAMIVPLEGAAETARIISWFLFSSCPQFDIFLTCVIYVLTHKFILDTAMKIAMPMKAAFIGYFLLTEAILISIFDNDLQLAGRWFQCLLLLGHTLRSFYYFTEEVRAPAPERGEVESEEELLGEEENGEENGEDAGEEEEAGKEGR